VLPQIASLSDHALSPEKRGEKRRAIKFGFDAAARQGAKRVLLLDLSRSGMRIQTSAHLEVGETLQVDIPEAGLVAARIVRSAPGETPPVYGAEFDEPINQASVSAVILASPAEAPSAAGQRQESWPAVSDFDANQPVPVSDWFLLAMAAISIVILGAFVFALGFLPISH